MAEGLDEGALVAEVDWEGDVHDVLALDDVHSESLEHEGHCIVLPVYLLLVDVDHVPVLLDLPLALEHEVPVLVRLQLSLVVLHRTHHVLAAGQTNLLTR